jgi:hypothetical protein
MQDRGHSRRYESYANKNGISDNHRYRGRNSDRPLPEAPYTEDTPPHLHHSGSILTFSLPVDCDGHATANHEYLPKAARVCK